VLANGNIYSAEKADEVLALTGARGLMIGRGVIRNPWLFRQIREQRRGEPIFQPAGRDVLDYVHALYDAVSTAGIRESAQINNMKKYLNFIGLGVEPTGEFLHRIRRATTGTEFFALCAEFLDHDEPMPLEPFPIPLNPKDVMAGATR
jgi:tRNA-dihydrouridine synthase